MKKLNSDKKFNKAQNTLVAYVEWLGNSNRLTIEEQDTLVRNIMELEAAAIDLGHKQLSY